MKYKLLELLKKDESLNMIFLNRLANLLDIKLLEL